MSNRDGFGSGLMIGAALGGLVGGVLGVVLSSRLSQDNSHPEMAQIKQSRRNNKVLEAESIEMARLNLEDKIAQLNHAIDDVRQQLGNVNGNVTPENPEESLRED